jgi:hypothetical protein
MKRRFAKPAKLIINIFPFDNLEKAMLRFWCQKPVIRIFNQEERVCSMFKQPMFYNRQMANRPKQPNIEAIPQAILPSGTCS